MHRSAWTGCGGEMIGDELSGSGLGALNKNLASGEAGTRDDQPPVTAGAEDRLSLRVVPPRDREQAALQVAANLTDAIAQYLLHADARVLNQADKMRATILGDLERLRSSVESLIGLFAERLQQEEEGLDSLRETTAQILDRLNRHAEAIRSFGEAQAHHVALLNQILEVLRRLGAAVESPPAAPANP